MRTLFAGLCAGAILFSLAGCEQKQAAPPPFLTKPATTLRTGVHEKWSVSYRGDVTIEQDKDGVVHIYSLARGDSTSTVVLSGTATFKVHDCNVVYVEEGVTVDCYGCPDVRAADKSTVNAYNCYKVRAEAGAKVNAYGNTTVTRQEPPAPPAPPAEKKN